VSTRQLFEPFWKYIAYQAIKDLTTRPQKTRLLAELLEVSVSDLLLLIQRYALPYLVLNGNQDVVQKIAEVREETHSWEPCLDQNNVGHILALLLVQDVPDVPAHSMGLFRQFSPHFDELSLVDIVKIEPLMTCLELLKAAGDAEESRKPLVSCDISTLLLKPLTNQWYRYEMH
jgi:serine/threonine-protein kinase ATR